MSRRPGSTHPAAAPPNGARSLYDSKVQAVVWQVVVVLVVLAITGSLIANLLHNLETRSIKTGYDFLGREAGFEIGESLLPYSPAASYGSALEVGLLNTLHVAVLGIALATVLGVLIGVATLSTNWLVARLADGYIHVLRNIPVLLQIILWYTILISERFLPHPRQAEPVLSILATQRGIYFPVPQWAEGWSYALIGIAAGVAFTIGLSSSRTGAAKPGWLAPSWPPLARYLAALVAFLLLPAAISVAMTGFGWLYAGVQLLLQAIGFGAGAFDLIRDVLAYLLSRTADLLVLLRPAAIGLVAGLAVSHLALERRQQTGTPLPLVRYGLAVTAALAIAGWLLGGAPTAISWPALRGFNIAGGTRITPEFAAILIGLTVYTSAFIAEIVRSGILAVPKGQVEAARALGLKESLVLRKITLPQALRVIVPPLTSQYLNLTKNSSLSVAIGYPDLVNVANTTINQTGQAIEGISIIMLVYLVTSLATSAFMNWYNGHVALRER